MSCSKELEGNNMKGIRGWPAGIFWCLLVTGSLLFLTAPLHGEEKPIRIGATVSLEGTYTELSFMVKNGYELWAKEVNARGGILGRKVELLFYDDKIRGDLVGPLYEKLITEDKVNLVFYQGYDQSETELPVLVKKLQSLDVEDLIFCGYPPDCYVFLKILQEMKFRPPGLALTIAPALPKFYTEVGPFAEGIFGPSQWEADKRLPFPGTLDFITKFIALTGDEPDYHACSAYSAGQILEKAIRKVDSIDQEKIRSYVANLDTVTIMGRFKVDSEGRQIGHNTILIQWQKGKKEIVYPTKMQTAPGVFSRNYRFE
jgi:branched-chain amino acid transport system substrate-binding protein